MGEWLQDYINQLKELWNNLNNRARIIITLGTVGVITALFFLIMFTGNPGYEPLFTGLNTRDADDIVKQLDEEGISYKISDNGGTIQVPASKVHKTRLDMAGKGLPSQGVVGFEIFNKSQFGTTDFERKVNFYRAVGGELSRSIQTMNAIDFAKVQISAPEKSLFAEKEKPAEASVLLKLKPGFNLKDSQVEAISNLVASSVQDLNSENVTIVDTAGNLLSQNTDSGDGHYSNQLTIQQFEIQRQFEKGLKNDLRAMLLKVLGPGNFTVQVNAKMNFDQRQIESETYSPVVDEEGIVRSQEKQTESYSGQQGQAGGVPGTETNIPQYQSEAGETEGSSNYEKTETVTNYEINRKIEKHQYAPGEIEKLSVAVMINNSQEDVDIDKIKESVQAAIGYNPERGDIVTVTGLAFDKSLEDEISEAKETALAARQRKTYIYGGLIALISIIILIIFFVFRRSGSSSEYNQGQAVDVTVGEQMEAAQKEAAATEISEEEKKRKELRNDLKELVTNQPEEVAHLLKNWLIEE